MATSIKARVDVSVSPYMEIDASNNQPKITSGLTSATFPSGYFGGGSFLSTVDANNNCTVTSVAVALQSNQGNTRHQISALSKNGILILKNSGYTTSAKDVAADAGSDIKVFKTDSASTIITVLTVENKDCFVIPMTDGNISTYYVQNANGSASKPVYMEGFFMHDTDS